MATSPKLGYLPARGCFITCDEDEWFKCMQALDAEEERDAVQELAYYRRSSRPEESNGIIQ